MSEKKFTTKTSTALIMPVTLLNQLLKLNPLLSLKNTFEKNSIEMLLLDGSTLFPSTTIITIGIGCGDFLNDAEFLVEGFCNKQFQISHGYNH